MKLGYHERGAKAIFALVASVSVISSSWALAHDNERHQKSFRRVATFPVYQNTSVDDEAIAEIVAATDDGNTLVYTDSVGQRIGFVDITDPANPLPGGIVPVGGEPTSVAVRGDWVLVCVDTSPSFTEPSGVMLVINAASHQVVRTIDLGGQPDCIAISHDGRYAVIAIENERDEDLGNGAPPQLPAGFVVIVELKSSPSSWTTRTVDLVGIPDLYPTDPEPEFVDINDRGIAAVTLQENNHVVLIDVRRALVVGDFSAGAADLDQIDTEDDELIEQNGSLAGVLREPDGVTWLSNDLLATADEGDLDGGSRGFTIFDAQGHVVHASGNSVEHLAARIGHYPDGRSDSKGAEPEGVKFAKYGGREYLFVGTERASVVAVYRLTHGHHNDDLTPEFEQVLPAGLGPEGLLAIPRRDLLVSAGENDSRADHFRGVLTIYQLERGQPTYPTVISEDRADGTPIPWGALSALAVDPEVPGLAYTLHDNAYRKSSIYQLDVSHEPARILGEIFLHDTSDLLSPDLIDDPADKSVNLDLEGICVAGAGGFWLVSEGDGSAASLPNFLVKASTDGTIEEVVRLPASLEAQQISSGFEGVSAVADASTVGGEFVYVAFQREWKDDPTSPSRLVKIGRYDPASGEWRFFRYPLDPPTSPNGGTVGLSELTAVGDGTFAVIERDNQAGTDARIKRLYSFSVTGLTPGLHGEALPLLTKTLVRDIVPDLKATNGAVLEKIEGLAILPDGDWIFLTDNDGVDDHTGETQLIHLTNR